MIRLENINVKFNDDYLIKDLSFTVEKGEKFLIYGQSGIGKTTIFRLLLGFEFPQTGKIYFEDKVLDVPTVWDIRQKVAYVSQNLDIGGGNVSRLIQRVFSYKSNAHITVSDERQKELLSFFRLKESILNEDFEKLSGGEKQRIAIIISVLLDRNIFLIDEPTSSLDIELKERVMKYFIENKTWTVLAISHDTDWLNRSGLRVVNLDKHYAHTRHI
jgi:putative ABC transport system ATP-binding protein